MISPKIGFIARHAKTVKECLKPFGAASQISLASSSALWYLNSLFYLLRWHFSFDQSGISASS